MLACSGDPCSGKPGGWDDAFPACLKSVPGLRHDPIPFAPERTARASGRSWRRAAPLSAAAILQQFNLVAFEDVSSTSHVHGRSYVGGQLASSSRAEFGEDGSLPASGYAALNVIGDASRFTRTVAAMVVGRVSNAIINSGVSLVLNGARDTIFNAAAYVGGSSTNDIFNGGRVSAIANDPTLSGYGASLFSEDFRQTLSRESDTIKTLAANSQAQRHGSVLASRATPDANGVAVFAIDNLSGISEFSFDLGDARTVLINCGIVSGDLAINFLAGSARNLGGKLLWNFYNAKSLEFLGAVGRQPPRPRRVGYEFRRHRRHGHRRQAVINGEIHQNPFTGELPPPRQAPEPASLALARRWPAGPDRRSPQGLSLRVARQRSCGREGAAHKAASFQLPRPPRRFAASEASRMSSVPVSQTRCLKVVLQPTLAPLPGSAVG